MRYILTMILMLPLMLQAQPYLISGGKDLVVHSVAAQILQKAYTKAGLQMKVLYLPFEESLQRADSGQTDGDLARIGTIIRKYPNLRRIPADIIEIQAVAFSKNTSLNIKKWSDLTGHTLTIVKGIKFIEEGTKDLKRQVVLSVPEAIEALKNDKSEVIVIPRLTGLSINAKIQGSTIKPVSHHLQTLLLYHYVNKKNTHLIPIITPILKAMKQSGEIDYMLRSHLRKTTRQN